jgi:drug/metabolite transporter (DMT)-like permease
MPPLTLAALRFALSAVPAVFFVKRPAAPLRLVAAYGLLLGVGEFGLLFTAIGLGAPAGLSSILLQSQAFFTALLAALLLGERLHAHNVAGMAVAGAGRVAAFSLVVPVFGIASAALVLGERFAPLDGVGAGLVVAGLLLHVFGGRLLVSRARGALQWLPAPGRHPDPAGPRRLCPTRRQHGNR